VRLLSFPADAGKGLGVYEKLHGFTDGATLSRHFNDVTQTYYGTAIRAFLKSLVEEQSVKDEMKAQQAAFRDMVLPESSAGQAISVAMRFGLVAAAGELATRYGVTGWPKGEATRAAKTCFEAWLGKRGGVGPDEERAMVEQVRGLLERHGESRFIKIEPMMWQTEDSSEKRVDDRQVHERYGYARYAKDRTVKEYLIFRQQWIDVFCQGFDPEAVGQVLVTQGFMALDGKHLSKLHRVPGVEKASRYYTVKASII
jgi:putative DNA primase/helicase